VASRKNSIIEHTQNHPTNSCLLLVNTHDGLIILAYTAERWIYKYSIALRNLLALFLFPTGVPLIPQGKR
jgi:hypothetical protein